MLEDRLAAHRKLMWGLLTLCAVLACLAFAYPMYVIRPFRGQSENELLLALAVKRWAPLLGTAAAVLAIFCAALVWRSARHSWSRLLCSATGLLTVLFAVLTQINVYEKMFHRIDVPESMPSSEAKLESDDMVLTVQLDGHARAYPIRMMGYHHIVNDLVGSIPIAATY